MRQGIFVKFFNTTKGFRFIQPQDGGKDIFVHINEVESTSLSSLREGGKSRASKLKKIKAK